MLALGAPEEQPKAQPKPNVRLNKKTTPESTKAEPKPNVRLNKKTTPGIKIDAPTKANKQKGLELDTTQDKLYWEGKGVPYIKTQLELRGVRFEPGQLRGVNNGNM